MNMPIIDLHSDLLSFLSHQPGRSPEDPASRSSHAQLLQGKVILQTLAIFTLTGHNSVHKGRTQVEHFKQLLSHYPTLFASCRFPLDSRSSRVHILPAFENASCFSAESEPFADSIQRLEDYIRTIGPIFYISLTWDHENRFGGGNWTTVGLKEDGKRLLEWMHGKKIAVDLSHTSDDLAHDILNFLDQGGLDIPVIASHSNFRVISGYPRNLPDELAREIVRRKGLIGLNFFAPFIHMTDPSAIVRHVEYALSLGAEDSLCFGADFFCDGDFPNLKTKYQRNSAYYPGLDNASVYPSLLQLLEKKLSLKEEQLLGLASKNAHRFLSSLFG